eukprot:jgi/Chrzof1/15162/Cz09g29180.t1
MYSTPLTNNPLYDSEDARTVSTGQGKEQKARRCSAFKRCCACIPWAPLLSTLLMAGALVVWYLYTARAHNALDSILQLITASADVQSKIDQAMQKLLLIVIVIISTIVGVAALLAAGVKIERSWQMAYCPRLGTPGRCTMQSYLVLVVTVNVVLWWIVAACVALLCVYFTLGAACFAGQQLTGAAMQLSSQSQDIQTLPNALDAANTRYISVTDNTPADIQKTPWYAELNSNVGSFLAASAQAGSIYVCPASCVDLRTAAGLLQLKQTCFCGQATLQPLQQQYDNAWHCILVCCAELATLAAAGSWLMMVGVGDFVHAKHHLTESVMSNVGGSSDARCAVSRVQPMAPDMPVMTKIDWKSSMQGDVEGPSDTLQQDDTFPGGPGTKGKSIKAWMYNRHN